jgi:hypothetical protein
MAVRTLTRPRDTVTRPVDAVTHEEMERYHEDVTGALRLLSKFAFIRRYLDRMRWRPRPRPRPQRYYEPAPEPETALSATDLWVGVPVGLWVAAILIFGVADSMTAVMAAGEVGAYIWGLVVMKTLVLGVLFFISYYFLWKHGWLIPLILCVVGTYLTLANLITYFSATA